MTQRAEPKPVQIALATFLEGRLALQKETAGAKSLRMSVAGADGSALLDPVVIGRVLDNLLTNAIRHAPPGGAVTLTVERGPGRLTLAVADTGCGVSPDMAEHLFEPFVTGRPEGTGLGLAIARELTDAHRGRLALRSAGNASGGAVFVLELPQPEIARTQEHT